MVFLIKHERLSLGLLLWGCSLWSYLETNDFFLSLLQKKIIVVKIPSLNSQKMRKPLSLGCITWLVKGGHAFLSFKFVLLLPHLLMVTFWSFNELMRQIVLILRWSLIAGRIPGRSAEEIEKYWTSRYSSSEWKLKGQNMDGVSPLEQQNFGGVLSTSLVVWYMSKSNSFA